MRVRAGRALSSLAAQPPLAVQRLRRLVRRLSSGPLGAAGPALAAILLLALLGATASWMVTMASEPAAWIGDAQAFAAASR
jgi:hypothetical protein